MNHIIKLEEKYWNDGFNVVADVNLDITVKKDNKYYLNKIMKSLRKEEIFDFSSEYIIGDGANSNPETIKLKIYSYNVYSIYKLSKNKQSIQENDERLGLRIKDFSFFICIVGNSSTKLKISWRNCRPLCYLL